ncbi:MAG TPA: YwqG family protein [Pirellulales bacterium]|nr:YwqG family protein [Pirellulales bacterium]
MDDDAWWGIERVTEEIRASALSEYADVLVQELRPSARLVVREAIVDHAELGLRSHLGGIPLLPRGIEWPMWDKRDFLQGQILRLEEKFEQDARASGLRDIAARMRDDLPIGPTPLVFLAQIFLDELHPSAPVRGWPADGSLAFFCDPSAWGFDPLTRGHCRVLFVAADERLLPQEAPTGFAGRGSVPGRRATFQREWTLPSSARRLDVSIWTNTNYRRLCGRLVRCSGADEPVHRFGGYPQEIQGSMELECQLVSNGIYCGNPDGYKDPRADALANGADDWRLLLQVDTDDRLGWEWGDAGRVYFWARQNEIEAGNFERAWSITQCY